MIRTGRKLFFFQWLESQVVKGEMFLGSCSCACTTRDGLDWETLAGPWGFFLCNSDSLNTSVPPQMSRSHLNLLPPALMLSNSDTSHFPAHVLGCVYLYAQPRTHGAVGRWPWRPGIGNSPVSATPGSQSFEKSLLKPHRAAYLLQIRLACAECPGTQMTQQA